ncbi:amino acid adenylation domain-containing protein [Paenibacillus sp. GSMTC-2017]|uniref:non-ribosomal peptide synthetase n=1 Tax=Paenibacillus sp. GSMTC-2017 TaxID=2794350 RepID=UPI0018D783AF|nr:non-ribosomal peptide synthetase [Paenibacillus sp. GSMTC-2017]MBH5320328.1 amino acid adenylation domain-containing protein [Paenibacillus sp. GSMTC-2017]
MNVPTSVLTLSDVTHPLTHPQKRIWYMENIFPGTSLANIGGPVRVKGLINFGLLEQAIHTLIRQHDGLRLQLAELDGEAIQIVKEYEKQPLDFFDFSMEADAETAFRSWVQNEASKPFQLVNSKLYYFAMFRISDKDNGYFVKCHHIISDGWSNQLTTSQIADHYTKLVNREVIDTELQSPSYLQYVKEAELYFESPRFIKSKQFWNEKFKSLPEGATQISVSSTEGRRHSLQLDIELSLRIQSFASGAGISLNTVFVLAYLIYLYKTTQQRDLVVGTPVLNRSGKKEKSMYGMFTTTMPFRFNLDTEATVEFALKLVQKGLMECYFHQRYPYDLLAQDLELKKKGYDQLFKASINYYNTKLLTEMNGVPIENEEFYNGHQLYELQLVIKHWSADGGLTLDFDYRLDKYSAEQIEELSGDLLLFIEQMLGKPQATIKSLSVLTEAERSREIYDYNKTNTEYPKERSVLQLFEDQVEQKPDDVAIVHERVQWTYRQLNEQANRLARYLKQKGIAHESIVGLWMQHSIEAVVAILAVMKADGTYLPIDPAYPDERIRYMLEDSGTELVLTNFTDATIVGYSGEILDYQGLLLDGLDSSNLAHVHEPHDLAYIIYTSGSTGRPKGAMIEHRGLTNYIWWAKKVYVRDEIPTFPLYSSLAFDLTVTSIFTPLICGGRICVYRDDGDEFILYRILRDNVSTIIKLTPAHLALLKERDYKHAVVKHFIVGGEDLKTNLAKEITDTFGGEIAIYNEYGPTETVVGCMIHQYNGNEDDRASVPIGVPADNVMLYILDPDLNPMKQGAIGELYIAGDGVARGYLHREELTRERFLDNPFVPGTRMYRTGDLAKRLADGKIEYGGRIDHQVKIRGYRIETAEIEKVIIQHEGILDAVVIDREHENLGKYLCAYIVKQSPLTTAELKQHLSLKLPSYMVPSMVVELDEIPLTINGKVNRVLLPEPDTTSAGESEYVSARTDREVRLVEIISGVLQNDRIGVNDHFYNLGGDSIKAIQVSSRLNRVGFSLKVRDILENPIIEQMALRVELLKTVNVAPQGLCEGKLEPLPITTWFFQQQLKRPEYYHQSVLLHLQAEVDVDVLKRILLQLVDHHDGLRLQVNLETHELSYHNERDRLLLVQSVSLADTDDHTQNVRMVELCETFKSQFHLQNTLLIGICLFDLGRNGKRLLITAHHLVIDGVSWRILLEDFAEALNSHSRGEIVTFPPKTASLQMWSQHVRNYLLPEQEQHYWQSISNRLTTIPIDYADGEASVRSSSTMEHCFTAEQTNKLLYECHQAYGTKPLELLVAVLTRAIYSSFSLKEAVVELESHGREQLRDEVDLSRTVGWFTSIYPVKLLQPVHESDESTLGSLIKSVKEQLRSIPMQGIGFGLLQAQQKLVADYDARKLMRFNFLGDFDGLWDNSWFTLASGSSGLDTSKENELTSLLDINAMIVDQSLRLSITYSRNRFKDATITRFMQSYNEALMLIINHCAHKGVMEYTPSDFETVALSQEELDSLFL